MPSTEPFYFLPGSFHALLLETVGQYNQRVAIKEAKYPIDIGTVLDSTLSDFLSTDQFLEICGRHHLQVFQEAEHPRHFLSHLAGHGIEKILNRAFPVHRSIEYDRSIHGCMLTCMLTYVKRYRYV